MIQATMAVEPLMNVADELEWLIRMHYEEIALHKDVIKLNPDWAKYFAMEEAGNLLVVTARDGERLIGYSIFFLTHHIHYKDALVAANDVIFIHPEYRGEKIAPKLIGYCEQELKNRGVIKVTWHIKTGQHDWSPFMLKNGYEKEEVVIGKIL